MRVEKVEKVEKAENFHPFHPLYRLSFYGLEIVSAKKVGANYAAEERVEVSVIADPMPISIA